MKRPIVASLVAVTWVMSPDASALTATFYGVRGNNWWVETDVTANAPVAGVDARVDGGAWQPLSPTTWGSWASSFYVATGSIVDFRAVDTSGNIALSGEYVWSTSPTPVADGGTVSDAGALASDAASSAADTGPASMDAGVPVADAGAAFADAGTPVKDAGAPGSDAGTLLVATFSNAKGNNWWVEVTVSASDPLIAVDASVNGNDWRSLPPTSWGSWASSFYVPSGAIVDFRARSTTGVAISGTYHWPDATPMDPPPPSPAPCAGGCGSGTRCCQTSALAGVADADKRHACLVPTPSGSCPAPDIVVDATALANLYFETRTFAAGDCPVNEGCTQAGTRKLLRFETITVNQGERDLVLGDPENTAWFVWDPCHGHYHFRDWASYRLVDGNGGVVATGHKQGFCLGDSLHYSGPRSAPYYQCNYQGISAGWGDDYVPTLDCQWVDVTGVPPGSYFLEVQVNPTGSVYESNTANNVSRVAVTVP